MNGKLTIKIRPEPWSASTAHWIVGWARAKAAAQPQKREIVFKFAKFYVVTVTRGEE